MDIQSTAACHPHSTHLSPSPPNPLDVNAASLRLNWEAFWAAVAKDHSHAGLIWNERTRSELREALQVVFNPNSTLKF